MQEQEGFVPLLRKAMDGDREAAERLLQECSDKVLYVILRLDT